MSTTLNTDTEKKPKFVPNTTKEKHKLDHYDNNSIIDTTPIEPENSVNSALTEDNLATECVVKVEESFKEIDSRILLNPVNFDAISTISSVDSSVHRNEKLPIKCIAKRKQSCLSCEYKTFNLDKLKYHSDKMHLAQICPKCGISLE